MREIVVTEFISLDGVVDRRDADRGARGSHPRGRQRHARPKLLRQGLVNELRLLVYPVVLGSGKRLFGEQGKTELKLTGAQPYASGVVNLTYADDFSDPTPSQPA